jgi:hypothetical protein
VDFGDSYIETMEFGMKHVPSWLEPQPSFPIEFTATMGELGRVRDHESGWRFRFVLGPGLEEILLAGMRHRAPGPAECVERRSWNGGSRPT